MGLLGNSFQHLSVAMVAREKVQGIHSSNIANADTPNFQADRRSFENVFSSLNVGSSVGQAATTNPKHFADISSSHATSGSIFSNSPSRSIDGNNVDVQKEMASMSENQLMHELTMQLLKGKITGMGNVITEGSR
ncbi:MAG: flagellar basal body rod protein FlgB [Mariprofundus sp.]|nr:flagellar basal body rod protein FlgB [Mariprofundus sp.]